MGYGNWKEERNLPYPAVSVFEVLVGTLNHLGYVIDRADSLLMAVTAAGRVRQGSWYGGTTSLRVAGGVLPLSEAGSKVILEIGPCDAPDPESQWRNKDNVKEVLDVLERALSV